MSNAAEKLEPQEEQEENLIQIGEVRKRLRNLEELCRKKQDAQKAYTDAIQATAEAAGIRRDVLRSYVTARLSDKVDANHQKAVQLSLLVDEFGK